MYRVRPGSGGMELGKTTSCEGFLYGKIEPRDRLRNNPKTGSDLRIQWRVI
ncbi:hypothetical protein GCM10010398_73760 [Streptomyces fimbriatus]